jgi:subtilisin family serine protease
VDLFAPGEDIVSAAVYGDSIFGLASGTSLAAPHVAGVAALYLQSHPFASPWQVQDAVTRAATRNRIRDAGRDSPNRLLYSGFLRGAEPRITVTAPNGAVDWGRGSQQQIEWTHNLGAGSYVRVLISRDGGATYTLIAGRVRNASATVGRLMWTVTGPNTTAARVQVEAIAAAAHGASNFVVADPYITITAPNGGDVWTVGSWAQIQWTHNLGRLDRVNVTFSKNGGSRYQTIVSNTPCDGAEAVVVRPSFSSRRARVGVSWARDMAISDVSDATFVVRHPRSQRSITQDSAVR